MQMQLNLKGNLYSYTYVQDCHLDFISVKVCGVCLMKCNNLNTLN